jgi:hypothetical protein
MRNPHHSEISKGQFGLLSVEWALLWPARYAVAATLSWPQEHPAYGSIQRTFSRAVSRFLEGLGNVWLMRGGRRLPRFSQNVHRHPWRDCAFRNDRSGIDRHKPRVPICGSVKRMTHASISCHLACHNFIAGFRVEYGNSGAGVHRGAFSLRRKRASPRPSPRASKCRAGLASDPGGVTWGKGCRQYVSGQ